MKIRMFPMLAAFALSLGVVPECAQSRDQGFTFREAGFMGTEQGKAAARMFIATQLPAGLPLADAQARLHDAGMRCVEKNTRSRIVTCEYYELAGGDGGTLGENVWTVRLYTNDQNLLVGASLDRGRTGFAPDGASDSVIVSRDNVAAEAACSRIMGLDAGQRPYEPCVSSLSRASLKTHDGHDLRGTARNTAPQNAADEMPGSKSVNYGQAFHDLRYYREEYACAHIGLDFGSSEFVFCVADLDAALFPADHAHN